MRITVYIPNYNYGSYLKTAINSVLQQTHKNFELIIIDDCSTDHSIDVIGKFNDKRIRTIFNTQQLGLVGCCNLALHHADDKTKYMIRLDADDWLTPTALEDLIDASQSGHADIIYPEYYEHIRNGETIHVEHNFNQYNEKRAPHGAGCLVRKGFLRSIGGYDDEFSCHDGFFLWLKANYAARRIVFLAKPTFTYYRHPTSLSTKLKKIKNTRDGILIKHA